VPFYVQTDKAEHLVRKDWSAMELEKMFRWVLMKCENDKLIYVLERICAAFRTF